MSTFHNSRHLGRRLPLLGFCFLLASPPLSAQTARDWIKDACYNELQQRQQNRLWASQIQRRNAGRIYLEKEIETVDGPIRRLLSVDGHEPSASERRQDDERLRTLMHNPKAQLAMKKNREGDEKKADDLVRAIPDAFLFEDQGYLEGVEKIAFRPNPAYNPATFEERALNALRGVILIDREEKRLVQLSGTLTQQVDFGDGAIAQLKKGGTIEVKRIRLSPGIWKTSFFSLNINGRIALFKPISKQREETLSDFRPLAPDTSIAQALEQLTLK
ncbi:MAG: hypothetical protein QOE55_5881 [Acidobacteriaceae bacterium]|nr:hypothetical protein [Acidobacteriaceae bacterium]